MDPKDVTRFIRPQDVPLLDPKILDPIVDTAAKDMAQAFPELSEDQWRKTLEQSLAEGEVIIVVDDRQKRVGLVRSDRPPFIALKDQPPANSKISPADPLDLNKWEEDI